MAAGLAVVIVVLAAILHLGGSALARLIPFETERGWVGERNAPGIAPIASGRGDIESYLQELGDRLGGNIVQVDVIGQDRAGDLGHEFERAALAHFFERDDERRPVGGLGGDNCECHRALLHFGGVAAHACLQRLRERADLADALKHVLDAPPEVAMLGIAAIDAVEIVEISIDQDLVDARLTGERIDADAGKTVTENETANRIENGLPGLFPVAAAGRGRCIGFCHHTVTYSRVGTLRQERFPLPSLCRRQTGGALIGLRQAPRIAAILAR